MVFLSQNFFEGVEDCIASGIRTEDVGYQLAYNRQELKNIIKEYSAKEVLQFFVFMIILKTLFLSFF